MRALFLKILDMGFAAGWLVLAVLVIRALMRKAPKALRCALWALVAVRLVCPFSLESSLSRVPDTQALFRQAVSQAASETDHVETEPPETVQNPDRHMPDALSETAELSVPVNTAKQTVSGPAPVHRTVDWISLGAILWAVGVVVMLGYAAVSYLQLRKQVSASLALSGQVYLCDYIDTPFILGIGKPKIYLPSSLPPDSAAYVLSHEKAHLRRLDHWWKPLGYVLLCVYWFHPLIWASYILLCRDIEMACDEAVVKSLDGPGKKAYSEALLTCSIPRHILAACPLAFGEVGVKQRIQNVLHYKKPRFWVVLACVIAMVLVAVCFLTDPVSRKITYGSTTLDTAAMEQLNPQPEIDWASAAEEMGPGVFTLFDPQFYDGYLFIGCQQEEDSTILCFRQESDATYSFLQQLTVGLDEHLIQLDPDTQLLSAFYQTDNTELGLYVITDEAVTGIETNSGFWNYFRIDHWPALVVFDKALWSEMEDFYFQVRKDVPPTLSFVMRENDNALEFQAAEEGNFGCSYLFSGYVSYYDGENPPGSYGMDHNDLAQLIQILTQLPEGSILPCTKPDSIALRTELYLRADNGLSDDYANTLLIFYDTPDRVILGFGHWDQTMGGFDIQDAPYQYFQIQDQALSDYLLALCDNSRKQVQLMVLNGDDLEYRHADAAIKLENHLGWEYEIVEYTDDSTPFGIHCRPQRYDEGWIFFSYWPNGYTPPEDYRQIELGAGSNHVSFVKGFSPENWENRYPDQIWSYELATNTLGDGDYVILNEGADSWLPQYDIEVSFLLPENGFADGRVVSEEDG